MQPLGAQIKGILRNATSSEHGPVGIVFGAVDGKGNVLALEAAGKRDIGDAGDTMTTDTIGSLYSTTKIIGNIAALQLVEQGKLQLDEPIEKVLPELANPQIVDVNGKLTPAKNKITLRHLMSHTAGFSYSFFHPSNVKYRLDTGLGFEGAGTKDGVTKIPLVHEPGTDWQYGVNIDWVGEAVARVSGKTLGQYLAENVFKPLGLVDTDFSVRDKSRVASMHQRSPDGKTIAKGEHLPYFTQSEPWHAAGHGLIGTVPDYLKISTIFLNGGKGANGAQILKPETLKLMFEDQLAIQGIHASVLDRPIPDALPQFTYPIMLMPGVSKGWSFGGLLTKDALPTGRNANSLWWAGLCNNYEHRDPSASVATFIMSQSFPFNDPKALNVWLACEAAVYKSLG